MNCCLWIILLLACRGNGGLGCQNNWRNNQCGNNWCGLERNNDCDDECGCNMNYDRDRGCGCEDVRYDVRDCCDVCDRDAYMNNGNDEWDCNDNEKRMSYETYGCQENGIPCPPPVPGNYKR